MNPLSPLRPLDVMLYRLRLFHVTPFEPDRLLPHLALAMVAHGHQDDRSTGGERNEVLENRVEREERERLADSDDEGPGVSLILRTATRYMLPLLGLFSIFLLVRGHSETGGGFIAGLVAAAAVMLCALAYDVQEARRVIHVNPHTLVAVGLLVVFASGVAGWIQGKPFLAGAWTELSVPGVGKLPLGTPLLFDVGVYLIVIGATLLALLNLAEE